MGFEEVFSGFTAVHFLFRAFEDDTRLLSPKVVAIPAHPHRKAQQLPRGEAGGGGVPQRQADAFQGLPESRTGCLGEETYRAGPVFCHHLSQRCARDRLQLWFEWLEKQFPS